MVAPIVEATNFEEDDFFGVQNSNEHAIFSNLKNELQLLCCWHGSPSKCDHPLKWWAKHEYQFPNVAFLACQMLGIVESQIETEQNFNIAGIIITFADLDLEAKT
jgi:hypothetical protein